MKKVSARQANHDFSKLLSRVERGEEILITKRANPWRYCPPIIRHGCHRNDKQPSIMQSRS
jgi:antitoxin (DNA-binding transcriptional repressor) of toxin-antitoxin stability system